MILRPTLPLMETDNYKYVLGALKFGIHERKLSVVLGTPGSGKSTILKDLMVLDPLHTHYILCSPNTTMKSMLLTIADIIQLHVKGDSNAVQKQITQALQEDPQHCIIFDECENLHRGNVSKIDVLRQIYDETFVPLVLCGTYKLKDLLTGDTHHSNHQPQIFRRLLKAELTTIKKEEVLAYLALLEQAYAVTFLPDAQTELFVLCLDHENGGLGIFIALLELIFSIVRPEWKDISRQREYGVSTPALRANEDFEPAQVNDSFIDVSKLKRVVIDKSTIRDASKFKMTK